MLRNEHRLCSELQASATGIVSVVKGFPFASSPYSHEISGLADAKSSGEMSASQWDVADSGPSTLHHFQRFPVAINGPADQPVRCRPQAVAPLLSCLAPKQTAEEGMEKAHRYGGLTINERLVVAGLLSSFEAAAKARGQATMIGLLAEVEVEDAAASVDAVLQDPGRYGY